MRSLSTARRKRAAQPAAGQEAATAPAAGRDVKKDVVFDGDKMGGNAKGWTNAPEGKASVAAQDKEVRRAGKKTVEFHAAGKAYMACGWNWCGWHPADAGTDVSGRKNLSFWAKVTGDKKPSQLTVELVSNDNKPREADRPVSILRRPAGRQVARGGGADQRPGQQEGVEPGEGLGGPLRHLVAGRDQLQPVRR